MASRVSYRRHRAREDELVTALFVLLTLRDHVRQLDLGIFVPKRIHHKAVAAVVDAREFLHVRVEEFEGFERRLRIVTVVEQRL